MDEMQDRDDRLPSVASSGGVSATTAESSAGPSGSAPLPAHIAEAASHRPAPGDASEANAGVEPAQDMKATGSSLPPEELERLSTDIVAALKTVYDPEIPADIYELGLIYSVDVDDDRNVAIEMTLTAPGCPVAGEMPVWVQNAVASVAGVADVKVEVVFSPPWDMSRMSEEARMAIGMF